MSWYDNAPKIAPPLHAQNVVINEFMASNGRTIADEDGDYEDWIELYNAGSEQVNLEGWGLTDDLDEPFQWIFPDIIIGPGEFLVVFASGKDRRGPIAGGGLDWYKTLEDALAQHAADRRPQNRSPLHSGWLDANFGNLHGRHPRDH